VEAGLRPAPPGILPLRLTSSTERGNMGWGLMENRGKLLVLIEHIRKELEELKSLAEGREPQACELEGLWEGIEVEEELFSKAKASFFRQGYTLAR